MATKKSDKSVKSTKAKASRAKASKAKAAKSAAPKKAAKPKGPPKEMGPRHPKARLAAKHGSKESLAKSLAGSLVRGDEDSSALADRLGKASNMQLLRLSRVVETVQQKYGSREKLIAAIGAARNKSKDKDYLAKLDTFSLPQLLDLVRSHERRARARA
jgi:hypothetical protein